VLRRVTAGNVPASARVPAWIISAPLFTRADLKKSASQPPQGCRHLRLVVHRYPSRGAVGWMPPTGAAPTPVCRYLAVKRRWERDAPKSNSLPLPRQCRGINPSPDAGLSPGTHTRNQVWPSPRPARTRFRRRSPHIRRRPPPDRPGMRSGWSARPPSGDPISSAPRSTKNRLFCSGRR